MRRDHPFSPTIDRRTLLQGAAGVGGALLLPGGARAQETPQRGGTLRVSMTYNPAALDPMTGRNAPDFNTLMALYDPLIDIDPQTLDPQSRAWRRRGPGKTRKSLVLDLRQGVKFHDGSAFDAEVVKFNLDRYRNDARSNLKADMESVEAVEVTGSHQVVIRLKRPNYSIPDDSGLSPRPDGVADVGQERAGRQRRPRAGRHRPVQICELAGQRPHRAHPQ